MNIREKSWIWGIVLVCTSLHADAASLFTAQEQQWIREHPVVRYAIDPDWWPIEYLEHGQHRGITRDYIEQVARVSGLRFERVDSPDWEATLERMGRGEIELSSAISKHLVSDKIRRQLLPTDTYFYGSTVLVTRAGEPIMFAARDLDGRTVAVKRGGAYGPYLREHFPGVKLLLVEKAEDALQAVAEGQADATLDVDRVLQPVIHSRFLDTLYLSGVLSDMPLVVAMGVTPRAPELVSIINKSFAALTARQTDQIDDRWVERTDFGAPSWGVILSYYAVEVGILSAGLLLLLSFARRARKEQRRAQSSEADKSAFLAMMSHEIRTPMNAVLSSVELLQRTRLDERQSELATLANYSAENLLDMLDAVLDASKLEAGRGELELLPVNLQRVAEGVVDIYREQARGRHNVLHLKTEGLDEVALLLDPVRIRQILSNLLSNAVKFTQQGEINLDISFKPGGADVGQLCMIVADTGMGIEPAQQSRLFQAFVRADNSTTRRYGGSGLGLSICRQLIELMGGRIELDSTPGVGTRVVCTLVVGHQQQPPQRDAAEAEAGRPDAAVLTTKRVLVVEDQPVNRQAIDLQLRALGYRSIIVDDGPAALESLKQHHDIAIILLDCHLPGMDGYQVAQHIRQQEQGGLARLPVIAISAMTSEEHVLKCIDAGFDGYLSKPLHLEHLRELLRLWVP